MRPLKQVAHRLPDFDLSVARSARCIYWRPIGASSPSSFLRFRSPLRSLFHLFLLVLFQFLFQISILVFWGMERAGIRLLGPGSGATSNYALPGRVRHLGDPRGRSRTVTEFGVGPVEWRKWERNLGIEEGHRQRLGKRNLS